MSKLGQWARCLAVAAALLGAAAPGHAERWALLIGVNGYRTVAPLRYSVADVKAVRELLVSQGGYAADHVIAMTDESRGEEAPTNNNIVFQFGELARRIGPEDTFLFYFTGHGYELEGRHYLLSINADPRSVDTLEISAVSLERLRRQAQGLRARQVIFLVDACRNKPVAALGDEPNPLSAELAKSVQVVARASGAGAAGSAVVFSCSPGERAYEWAARGHSVFGYYLLEGLSGKAAEATGEVTVTGLAEYLQREVPTASRQVTGDEKQHPWLEAQGAARLVVARVAPPAPIAPGTVRELPTTATLRVSSDPAGATVTVDGTASGTTPCDITVPLGAAVERRVTVTVEKEGSVARKAEVTLYPGRVSEWADVKLVEDVGFYVNRGAAYVGTGDYDRAIADFDKAIALEPDSAGAYANRGWAYAGKGDYDRAIADFDKEIALEPDSAKAYAGRGRAYAEKGDYDRALADGGKAVALRPDLAQAYITRGWAYAKRGDYDRAIADFNKEIALEPNLAGAYANRGTAYAMKGDYDRAIADFDKAIALEPGDARIYASRGRAHAEKGDYDRAIADCGKAIALKPDLAEAYAGRGKAYAEKGDYSHAIADYRKCSELLPASGPRAAYIRARLAELEGR